MNPESPTPTNPADPPQFETRHGRWLNRLTLAAAALILALAYGRVFTLVTAQDPFWYIALARQALGGRTIAPELAPGLSFVSPGFPLLLSGLIRVFGPYSPYALNLVLGLGFLALFSGIVRRVFPGDGVPALPLAMLMLLVMAGYPYYPHFLLYPFRGMPIYVLILMGYHVVLACEDRDRSAWLALASLPFALAIVIREPAVFGLAGAMLYLALDRSRSGRERLTRLGWFLLPLGLGGVGVLLAGWASGRLVSHQLLSWSDILFGKPPGQIATEAVHTAWTMGGFLVRSVTWLGLPLLAWGVLRSRSSRGALTLFLTPALLLFAFYTLYVPHYRYFLSVLIFLVPFLGVGLAAALQTATRRRPRFTPRLITVTTLLLLGTASLQANRLTPWGRKVDKEDVRALRREVESLAPSSPALFIDRRSRYLGDALMCFTEASLPSPFQVRELLARNEPCFYFEPLDDGCFYESYLDGTLTDSMVGTERILRHSADLSRLNKAVLFAGGEFAIRQVQARTNLHTRTYAVGTHSRNTVLWLDFGDRDPEPVHVRVHTPDHATVGEWTSPRGQLVEGFAIPGHRLSTGYLYIRLTSDSPLPLETLIGLRIGEEAMPFPLDRHRRLSTQAWVYPPFEPQPLTAPFAAVLDREGVLALPFPHGDEYRTVVITLVLDPATLRHPGIQGHLSASVRDVSAGEHDIPLHQRGAHVRFSVSKPDDGLIPLRLANRSSPQTPLIIRQVSIEPTDWE